MSATLTEKQEAARELMASEVKHVLLEGGSRSGKSAIICRQIIARALKASKSRHVILRFKFKHAKESIGMDTLPKMLDLCFPGVSYKLNKSDWVFYFENGSEIWIAGLDDKERTEKILGKEFATMFLNEASQISWSARNLALTRLAQKCEYEINGEKQVLQLKMYYDLNPPSKAHWAYQVFHLGRDPETRQALADQHMFSWIKMNPVDNAENLNPDYIRELQNQSGRMRRRFLDGEYGEVAPGQLWTEEMIDRYRCDGDDELPEMQRIVVAIDPSGASDEDNKENDEIGIVVVGLGSDGRAYLMEDLTCKGGPGTWGAIAVSAYERHMADRIVAETNYGGDMVRFVVQAAKPGVPFKKLTASRGKVVRAEPIAGLHEQGKIRFSGRFVDLEEELCAFTTTGYVGEGSPNRADAFVWAVTELFPSVMKMEKMKQKRDAVERRSARAVAGGSTGWLGA